MEDKGKKVLRYPLDILARLGQNPEKNRTIFYTTTVIYLFLGTIALLTIIIQFFYSSGEAIEISQNCEALVGLVQFISRLLIGTIKINNFLGMIKDSKNFWTVKTFLATHEVGFEAIFEGTLLLEQLYLRLGIFMSILLVITPLFTKQLPTGVWEFLMPVLIIYIVAWDLLFLSFCLHTRTQYKMLKHALQVLIISTVLDKAEEKGQLSKLKSYIRYHDFLLRFSRNMQDTYSPFMLVEYSSILLVMFAEMYVAFESNDSFQLPRSGFVMMSASIQLTFYCLPLNFISDESVLVSQGIYESNWYLKNAPGLKSVILLIIQRSQREIIFKAGGLFEMNCRTIPNVVKMAYSLCTIIRASKRI